MNDSLVTVVIPTKDRPDFLTRALRSVVSQSYPNLEILVVDDGSLPPAVIPSEIEKDDRIRVLRLNSSRGPAAARNWGIANARGSLIAFLDDDDEFTPQRIENGVIVLENRPDNVALCECGHSGWFENRLVYEYAPREQGLREALLREPSIALPTIMVRRFAFDVVGLFDPALDRYEDWDLWLRMTDVYELATIPTIDVRRRLHHPIPAAVRLRAYKRMFQRIAPRVRALPPAKQLQLWAWHARFVMYRVIEVLVERVAGRQFLQKLKIRRLYRSRMRR